MSQTLIPFEKEAVKAYLDRNIVFWREQLAAGNVVADDYIDAYQSVRMTLFGELLPIEGGTTQRAADGAKWRCKSCGFSSGVEYSVCVKCKSPRR